MPCSLSAARRTVWARRTKSCRNCPKNAFPHPPSEKSDVFLATKTVCLVVVAFCLICSQNPHAHSASIYACMARTYMALFLSLPLSVSVVVFVSVFSLSLYIYIHIYIYIYTCTQIFAFAYKWIDRHSFSISWAEV